ncbi:unnamed protein product, partial [Tilletia caries]
MPEMFTDDEDDLGEGVNWVRCDVPSCGQWYHIRCLEFKSRNGKKSKKAYQVKPKEGKDWMCA